MGKIDTTLSALEKLSDDLITLSESTNSSLPEDTASRLRDGLGVLKEAVSQLIRDKENLQGEIRWLRSKVEGADTFKMRKNVYYTASGDGPFCPYCFENRGKRIRLMELPPDAAGVSFYKCRMCESRYEKELDTDKKS